VAINIHLFIFEFKVLDSTGGCDSFNNLMAPGLEKGEYKLF
jgi:hypothetical protein